MCCFAAGNHPHYMGKEQGCLFDLVLITYSLIVSFWEQRIPERISQASRRVSSYVLSWKFRLSLLYVTYLCSLLFNFYSMCIKFMLSKVRCRTKQNTLFLPLVSLGLLASMTPTVYSEFMQNSSYWSTQSSHKSAPNVYTQRYFICSSSHSWHILSILWQSKS